MEYCSYISSAALNAAFNSSNIGIVFDIFHEGQGAKVMWPFMNSIAAHSGIREGDVVLEINGRKIGTTQEAIQLSYTCPPKGSIAIQRGEKTETIVYQ